MTAPNQNPGPCGGAAVGCCGNRVPPALVAKFTGPSCGFSAPISLLWNGSSAWVAQMVGCQGFESVTLACAGSTSNDFTLTIGGVSGCKYTITLTSGMCDPFELVFSATQTGAGAPPGVNTCNCCVNGTVFTITVTPA